MTTKVTFAQILQEVSEQPLVKNKVNPHFKNKYADLDACQAAVLPVLFKYGWSLTVNTTVEMFGEQPYVLLEMAVVDNEDVVRRRSIYPVAPLSEKPQTIGSGITYARRYVLCAMFCLTADEDDDGNVASGIPPIVDPVKPSVPRPGIRRLS